LLDEVTIGSGSDMEKDEVNIEGLSSDQSDVDEEDLDGATERISLTQVHGCITTCLF